MRTPRRIMVGIIGLGVMARSHLDEMLRSQDAEVVAFCEPSPDAALAAAAMFENAGLPVPPNENDWTRFVDRYADRLDAVLIATPHALHFSQATACLEAGIDVLLEKPMVMTTDEATRLVEVRQRTGRVLVVAFQGGLSAQVREACRLLRSGELGPILNVDAATWQDWDAVTRGGWRQDPRASGGGFLFDTGAHLLNTVVDLLGEEITEVAARLEGDGRPVDVRAVVMGRTPSGVLVTMNACGTTIPSCHSEIRVYTSLAILRTGAWGEALEIQRAGDDRYRRVRSLTPVSVWQRFVDVREGRYPNPCPPEVGLRMAKLWDAIRESAARGGNLVRIPPVSAGNPSRDGIADVPLGVSLGAPARVEGEVLT